ncbi:Disintegrin and metalloproteinase domain-containing protein 1 [Fukomys damarensis]|uniref:Disintegrin and metalloproteinase domain-containing protein 1 n=1 Tax=Fukomys damarensis TaxID=885580 RepID=A0A091CVD1_FUKDA|nr:Disintegrin and metalloproteinase domain-containing protein 1 [Fukomys damarensis]
MLLLGIVLLPSIHGHLGPGHYSSYEIVIPKSLTVKGTEDPAEKTSYTLLMQGRKQRVHLKVRRDYFVHDFPVYSYHNGILGQEIPSISHDCHYEGYIEGVPGSFVSVNTCSGLRGILIKEQTSYVIEPILSSKRFEHALYSVAQQAPVSCSISPRDSQAVSTSQQQESRKPHDLQALSYLWSRTKYVEMFVVVNNQRFQMWGSDVNETVQRVVDVVALANVFTRGINTEVVLAGMEIWTEGDLTEVPGDLQVTLRNFNSWRQGELLPRVRHDVAHMIVGHHPGGTWGQAFLSGACTSGFAAAVEAFHHEDALLFAALMVHQLGHNLGIQHDHSACVCKGRHFCLMHETVTKESGFSNCSSDYLYRFLHEHKGACLFNKPRCKSRGRRDANCGNGEVEAPEECDCGSACDGDPCCEPTCKLKENAQCSRGLCCDKCSFKKEGVVCRFAHRECDLSEYCDGNSAECPEDSYKQDGTLCDRIYYCFEGQCRYPDLQCLNLYGYPARSAPEACYLSMNSKAHQFGNCGHPTENAAYINCTGDDIFCGKLICTDVQALPRRMSHYTLIQVAHGDDWCWSMDAYNTTDDDVEHGSYCAPNKICDGYVCTEYSVLHHDCDSELLCHGNGVCNNLRHCHCNDGFAPPDCRYPGYGGSVDSGPVPKPLNRILIEDDIRKHTVSNEDANRGSENDKNQSIGKMVYIFPLFLLMLFLVLIIAAIVRTRKELSLCSEGDLEENPEVIVPEQIVHEGQGPEDSPTEEANT